LKYQPLVDLQKEKQDISVPLFNRNKTIFGRRMTFILTSSMMPILRKPKQIKTPHQNTSSRSGDWVVTATQSLCKCGGLQFKTIKITGG
jgi:hypothetical protein